MTGLGGGLDVVGWVGRELAVGSDGLGLMRRGGWVGGGLVLKTPKNEFVPLIKRNNFIVSPSRDSATFQSYRTGRIPL